MITQSPEDETDSEYSNAVPGIVESTETGNKMVVGGVQGLGAGYGCPFVGVGLRF